MRMVLPRSSSLPALANSFTTIPASSRLQPASLPRSCRVMVSSRPSGRACACDSASTTLFFGTSRCRADLNRDWKPGSPLRRSKAFLVMSARSGPDLLFQQCHLARLVFPLLGVGGRVLLLGDHRPVLRQRGV